MNDQNIAALQSPDTQTQSEKFDQDTIDAFVNKRVGISRTGLNVKAIIGVFIFGWLMKMNYDDLGQKNTGWAFLIAMAIVFAIGRQIEPMIFILGLIIYVVSWIHTNILLSNKQRIAREQFFKENT